MFTLSDNSTKLDLGSSHSFKELFFSVRKKGTYCAYTATTSPKCGACCVVSITIWKMGSGSY